METGRMRDIFSDIYKKNSWGGRVSRSGRGSDSDQTGRLAFELRRMIAKLGLRDVVDLGCGDANWMMNLVGLFDCYTGVDIVPSLIEQNRINYNRDWIHFVEGDIVRDSFHMARRDAIFCRDVLCHLEHEDTLCFLDNVRKSGAKWFVSTTFQEIVPVDGYPSVRRRNPDNVAAVGLWYAIVLTLPPFNLPPPEHTILEGCPDAGFEDKQLGFWRVKNM